LKCDDTCAETRFLLSAKWTSLFKSAGVSVQSTAGSRGVRISGSNAGYTMFRGSVKNTGYPLHSPVSSSPPFQCLTMCHHISTGLYTLASGTSVINDLHFAHPLCLYHSFATTVSQPQQCHNHNSITNTTVSQPQQYNNYNSVTTTTV
jgi:hypothetical protein